MRSETELVLDIGWEHQYWSLVATMFDHRSNLVSFDGTKHELLPEINESRLKDEFPESEISVGPR